jgi:hypothetical protein
MRGAADKRSLRTPNHKLQQTAAAILVLESSLSLSAAAAAELNVRRQGQQGTMKKRVRLVEVYLHRSSKSVLVFPYVFYMAGEAAPSGDAAELVGPAAPAAIGKQLLRLLSAGKEADIEAMKARRMEQLRRYWRGEDAPQKTVRGATWNHLLSKYPALTKGPGTYLRQFSVCQVLESDGWKQRKVVREEASEYRGCTTDGDVERIPITESPGELGKRVLEFLRR